MGGTKQRGQEPHLIKKAVAWGAAAAGLYLSYRTGEAYGESFKPKPLKGQNPELERSLINGVRHSTRTIRQK